MFCYKKLPPLPVFLRAMFLCRPISSSLGSQGQLRLCFQENSGMSSSFWNAVDQLEKAVCRSICMKIQEANGRRLINKKELVCLSMQIWVREGWFWVQWRVWAHIALWIGYMLPPALAFPCTPSLPGLWLESGEVEIQKQRGVSVKPLEDFANRKTHYLVACVTEYNTNGQ